MKITILGSGTSVGVPQIGCTCKVCTSSDPRDKRLRCSGLMETNGVRVLIDCGPDFREQMLRLNDFRPIDGVLVTHEHYDHVGGLDDLRPFCSFREIPVCAEDYVADRLQSRMPYCFVKHPYPGIPHIPLTRLRAGESFALSNGEGRRVEPRTAWPASHIGLSYRTDGLDYRYAYPARRILFLFARAGLLDNERTSF